MVAVCATVPFNNKVLLPVAVNTPVLLMGTAEDKPSVKPPEPKLNVVVAATDVVNEPTLALAPRVTFVFAVLTVITPYVGVVLGGNSLAVVTAPPVL